MVPLNCSQATPTPDHARIHTYLVQKLYRLVVVSGGADPLVMALFIVLEVSQPVAGAYLNLEFGTLPIRKMIGIDNKCYLYVSLELNG